MQHLSFILLLSFFSFQVSAKLQKPRKVSDSETVLYEKDPEEKEPDTCYGKDMTNFLSSARIVPVTSTSGEVEAFRIEEVRHTNHLYLIMGLKVKDEVYSKDGVPCNSVAQAVPCLAILLKGQTYTFRVKRDGKMIKIKSSCNKHISTEIE